MTSFKSNNKLEKILCNLAHDNLPTFFLEGFKKNLSLTLSINWPKKPKFIFTSNNFETDEIFKLYSAINIEKKTKYIVGQHGNIYGTHFCSSNYKLEPQINLLVGAGKHKKVTPLLCFQKIIIFSQVVEILFIIQFIFIITIHTINIVIWLQT